MTIDKYIKFDKITIKKTHNLQCVLKLPYFFNCQTPASFLMFVLPVFLHLIIH